MHELYEPGIVCIKSMKLLTILFIFGAMALSTIAFVLPMPLRVDPKVFSAQLFVIIMVTLWYFSAALLFLLALKDFKAQAQRAYYLVSMGVMVIGIFSVAWLPVATYLFDQNLISPFYAGSMIVSSIGMGMIYGGVRRFSELVDASGRRIPWRWIIGTLAMGILVIFLLPQPPGTPNALVNSGIDNDLLHAGKWLEFSFCLLTIRLIWLMRQHLGKPYMRALWPLGAYAALDMFFLVSGVLMEDFWAVSAGVYTLIALGVIILPLTLILAGYRFCRLYAYAPRDHKHSTPSLIDIIIYVASLASRPRDIDPFLDGLRRVTAFTRSKDGVQDLPEQELGQVYLQVETYLVTKEPVLGLSRESLRVRVDAYFSFEAGTIIKNLPDKLGTQQ
jgi:hypothetical protein